MMIDDDFSGTQPKAVKTIGQMLVAPTPKAGMPPTAVAPKAGMPPTAVATALAVAMEGLKPPKKKAASPKGKAEAVAAPLADAVPPNPAITTAIKSPSPAGPPSKAGSVASVARTDWTARQPSELCNLYRRVVAKANTMPPAAKEPAELK